MMKGRKKNGKTKNEKMMIPRKRRSEKGTL
jgi:hypothetical protein